MRSEQPKYFAMVKITYFIIIFELGPMPDRLTLRQFQNTEANSCRALSTVLGHCCIKLCNDVLPQVSRLHDFYPASVTHEE